MSLAELPPIRIPEILSGSAPGPYKAGRRRRVLLVGSGEELEIITQLVVDRAVGSAVVWLEATNWSAAHACIASSRVDVILLHTATAVGPEWNSFRASLAKAKEPPLLLGVGTRANDATLQRLLDQGVQQIFSLRALTATQEIKESLFSALGGHLIGARPRRPVIEPVASVIHVTGSVITQVEGEDKSDSSAEVQVSR